jgi:hypothetical protein
MNATDATAAVVGTLVSLLLFAGFYVWMALALSAVFRKSGVEPFKAWVPILNTVVVLQLAGLSPWLVVLAFIPILNIAFLVVFAIALYRVNVAFGYGVGMTVLGLLLFPVWASIVGWGSARWVGRETDAASRAGAGLRRTSSDGADPATAGDGGSRPETRAFPAAAAGAAGDFAPLAFAPPAPRAPADFTAEAHPSAPASAVEDRAPVPPMPPAPAPSPAPAAAARPDIAAAPAAAARFDVATEQPAAAPSGEGEPHGAWTPPAVPGRPLAATPVNGNGNGAHHPEAEEMDRWQGFELDAADLSDEVTGAFPEAPGPISAVPAAGPAAPVPPIVAANAAPRRTSAEIHPAPAAATSEDIVRPPVTRVPVADGDGGHREPWAPARSPLSDADAFPEASGPVSAINGAPEAGAPRSARSSVSAFHEKPEIPDEQDVFEETIIARRKRTDWTLVPPTGDPVALSAEVVILGRRPAGDPTFPGAQLVSIQDGTVSKTHARLRLRGDRWYVTDLDSTNGVLFATVMGTEVEAPPGEEVEAGDRFLLGDAEVRLKRSDG